MANTDIVTRSGKGAPLSAIDHDQNMNGLSGVVEQQTGTTYTVVYTDQGKTIELNNAAMVCTLDSIATIAAAIDTSNFRVTLKNIFAGAATVQRSSTDTIDGLTSITLANNESITLQTDNTGGIWTIYATGRVISDATLTTPAINGGTITGAAISTGTINGTATRNFVPLAVPVLLVNSATINADVLIDMSVTYAQAATDNAVMAQCTGFISIGNATPVAGSELNCHSSAPGAPALQYRKLASREDYSGSPTAVASGGFNVILDGSSDFYWRHRGLFGSTGSPSCIIYLTGYWV